MAAPLLARRAAILAFVALGKGVKGAYNGRPVQILGGIV